MSVSIQRFGLQDQASDIVNEIRENGVAIVEHLFPPEVMDRLLARLSDDFDAQSTTEFMDGTKKTVGALFAHGREFSEHLLDNDPILAVVDRILLPATPMATSAEPLPESSLSSALRHHTAHGVIPDPLVGPNCHHYRINASVAMQVWKGGDNQRLHRDQWRYLPFMRRDPAGPELTLAMMVAATDFTAENGATRYVPGSNHWPEERQPEEREIIQAVMPKGSVAFWLGSVHHGFGINQTGVPRTGFIFSYALDHLAQEENQFLAVPTHIACTLPLRARQLLGYRSSLAINWVMGLDKDDMTRAGSSSLFA